MIKLDEDKRKEAEETESCNGKEAMEEDLRRESERIKF